MGNVTAQASWIFDAAEESALQEFCHSLSARSHLKLLVDTPDIGMNRFVADSQFLGNFLVKKTLRQAIEHFLFTRVKDFR